MHYDFNNFDLDWRLEFASSFAQWMAQPVFDMGTNRAGWGA
jgi:hypothetical protein